MAKLMLTAMMVFLASCAFAPKRAPASAEKWSFLILSDIHVYTMEREGRKIVPKDFTLLVEQLVPYVKENNVKFIVLLGDSTGGNKDDKYSLARVKMWWDELYHALSPLMEKGVKVLPVAGNHDFYTENHRGGYEYAWRKFMEGQAPEGGPLYYVFTNGELELFLLHSVEYNLGLKQEEWLKNELARRKANGKTKIAMGHVALYTRLIRRPFIKFGDKIRGILEGGGVSHYVAGHEHYFWDEFIGMGQFRQTIMGTSSGTYNFVPNIEHYSRFCKNDVCQMEPDGNSFLVNPAGRRQIYKQMFLHFEVDKKDYHLRPMAFDKGNILPFTLGPR